MFIKKTSIPAYEMRTILSNAGYREEQIIKKSRWIFLSKDKRYYKFVMPNPNYGKGLDLTKSFSCMYDRRTKRFVN